MNQIPANLVHGELRNATFEVKKMPTSIAFPDSGDNQGNQNSVETKTAQGDVRAVWQAISTFDLLT